MTLSNQPNRVEAKIDQAAELFCEGARVLCAMLNDAEGTVRFKDWAASLRDLEELDSGLATNDHLIWLWEALRTAPDLRDSFGTLLAATVPWTDKNQRFEVFDPGEWFVIGMKGDEVAYLLQEVSNSPEQERVCVHTKEKLRMRPGKGDRLECCDCRADVMIHVDEVFSKTREADIMRIEEDRIELFDGLVKVEVNSLNQAYTIASRRLEPERRGHGGRTYNHVVHVQKGRRARLEEIRKHVESSCWANKPEDSTSDQSSTSQVKQKQAPRTLFD